MKLIKETSSQPPRAYPRTPSLGKGEWRGEQTCWNRDLHFTLTTDYADYADNGGESSTIISVSVPTQGYLRRTVWSLLCSAIAL